MRASKSCALQAKRSVSRAASSAWRTLNSGWLGARKLVPGAHELAVVAAVNPIAERRAQLCGNAARMLDGEIGDAAPCMEPLGRDDGLGRTGGNASTAGAAMRARRRIRRQGQIGQDLA